LRNEALRICHEGNEIARGIINFSSEELFGPQSNLTQDIPRFTGAHIELNSLVRILNLQFGADFEPG
jgi:glutamate 5-kinase